MPTGPVPAAARERRRIVPTAHGQVHVRLHGRPDDAVPLVLLHMSPRSSEMWGRLQRALGRATIAPDRLGYGFSDAPSRELSMHEYAAVTLEALDALGVRGRFDVLGMHTGALEAVELAHLAPARVRHLGMIAIPVFDAAERERGLGSFAQMKFVPLEDGSHLVKAWQGRFAFRHPPWDLVDIQRRLVDYLLAPWPGQAYTAVFGYDAAPRLASLGRPVVAFAPRDDVYEQTLRSRALLPAGSTYVDLPDFDLEMLRVRVDEFARLVGTHLPG
jgi:pimeloyl-ACP methyl ester carboxylesterase